MRATARQLRADRGLVRIRHRHRGPKASGAVVATKRGVPGPGATLESHRQFWTAFFTGGEHLVEEDNPLVEGDISPPGVRRDEHPKLGSGAPAADSSGRSRSRPRRGGSRPKGSGYGLRAPSGDARRLRQARPRRSGRGDRRLGRRRIRRGVPGHHFLQEGVRGDPGPARPALPGKRRAPRRGGQGVDVRGHRRQLAGLAHGGTLFLDEVGEIPLHTQVALLRVLQERRFERVGGSQSVQVDVRVIAATNKELEAAMNAGSFRPDLFYRLNVFPIQVPSLRERREDIPLLVEYFIDRFATKAGKRFSRIKRKSLDLLQSYDWPGNIRELQNVIERSVILCDTNEFSVDANWLASGPARKERKRQTLDEHLNGEERQVIEAALAEAGGKVSGPSGAAAKLGMPATTLYSKIQSLRIDKSRFKRD